MSRILMGGAAARTTGALVWVVAVDVVVVFPVEMNDVDERNAD